jgi:hypothetical protein
VLSCSFWSALSRGVPGSCITLDTLSAFQVQQANPELAPLVVHTHAVVVRNVGRLPARNVRLGHNVLPPNFTIYPPRLSRIERLPGDRNEIVFDTLVPGEQLTISYLYQPPLTWNQINTDVRSDEGLAQVINVLPARQYPKWLIRVLTFLLIIGAVASLYLLMASFLFFYERFK